MILVTGAAGFIGSHLVDRLLAEGREVAGLDNFDPFYGRALKEANLSRARRDPRFTLLEADIRDPVAVTAALDSLAVPIEAIVHLAARAGVRPSIADPVGYAATNIQGTLHLLEAARLRGVRRFVLASSSSVYGVNPRVPWREDDHALEPISPYAATKLAAEHLGRVHATLHGMTVVALRFFTVYGPRQRPDLAIARFAGLLRRGEPLPFFGDGSTRRDYTFVDDIVDGVVRAAAFDAPGFHVINLGNHHTVSLAEMVATLGAVFGREPVLDRRPEQPGDVPRTWASVDRARELLGWSPRTALPEGVRAYRAWLETADPAR